MTANSLRVKELVSLQELLASLRDPLVLGFLDKLRSAGYSEKTQRDKRSIVAAFLRWTRHCQVNILDLGEAHLDAFLEGRRPCKNSRWRYAHNPLRAFLAYLRQDLLIPGVSPPIDTSPSSELLRRYLDYLRDERGLTKQSITIYTPLVRTAIAELTMEVASKHTGDWDADAAQRFLLKHIRNRSSECVRLIAVTLRSLLRFLFLRGETAIDLSLAVPSFRKWRQASVPTYLSPMEVESVLSAPDLSTATGRRDHAVILLLARLGLRAGEVVRLELDDIFWRTGELLVRGKGRLMDHLPLPPDVGAALALYLREDRGESVSRRVFLRLYAPRTGLAGPAAVGHIVRKLLLRAGIIRTSRGAAHVFRHSLATRMIRHGASIPEIAEVLRHRSQNTTGIYAKVAFETLREVSRPWPVYGGAR